MSANCAIYVPSRHYGKAGPCQSRRAVKRIQMGDTPVLACVGHRNYIRGGKVPLLNKARR